MLYGCRVGPLAVVCVRCVVAEILSALEHMHKAVSLGTDDAPHASCQDSLMLHAQISSCLRRRPCFSCSDACDIRGTCIATSSPKTSSWMPRCHALLMCLFTPHLHVISSCVPSCLLYHRVPPILVPSVPTYAAVPSLSSSVQPLPSTSFALTLLYPRPP